MVAIDPIDATTRDLARRTYITCTLMILALILVQVSAVEAQEPSELERIEREMAERGEKNRALNRLTFEMEDELDQIRSRMGALSAREHELFNQIYDEFHFYPPLEDSEREGVVQGWCQRRHGMSRWMEDPWNLTAQCERQVMPQIRTRLEEYDRIRNQVRAEDRRYGDVRDRLEALNEERTIGSNAFIKLARRQMELRAPIVNPRIEEITRILQDMTDAGSDEAKHQRMELLAERAMLLQERKEWHYDVDMTSEEHLIAFVAYVDDERALVEDCAAAAELAAELGESRRWREFSKCKEERGFST